MSKNVAFFELVQPEGFHNPLSYSRLATPFAQRGELWEL